MLEYLTMRLGNGARIAVLGGGPAGSFFALYLLQYAAADRMDLEVDLFEWRSFSDRGPKGCNRCAGILSASLLRNLGELDINVPEEVIRAHIASYHLHSPFGVIDIPNPDPGAEILSVFRGGGPLSNAQGSLPSFDGFLLDCALRRGARLVHERVLRVDVERRPRVFLEDGPRGYDLLVLANGLNSGAIQIAGLPYRPPATLAMSQDELHCRKEDIAQYFGSSVRAFLLPHTGLIFASVVPKGEFLNVSLLARGGPPDLDGFLEHDLVKEALPFPYKRSCGCRPRICVGRAANYYGDGFVAIGDAAVSRLYKDGIGSALLSARQAALTAIRYGTSRHDFASHYAPFCRALHNDNRMGRIIFAVHNRTKDSRRFFRVQARLINAEGSLPFTGQVFRKVLWGMFTGSYTYRQILGMASNPKVVARVAREYLTRHGARVVEAKL